MTTTKAINPKFVDSKFIEAEFNIYCQKNSQPYIDTVHGEVKGRFGIHQNEDGFLVLTHLPSGMAVITGKFSTLAANAPSYSYKMPRKRKLKSLFRKAINAFNSLQGIDNPEINRDKEMLSKMKSLLKETIYS